MSQAEQGFELHPQLAKDCLVVGDLPLDRVLLMNDANYPWLVLVPRRAGLRELYELEEADLALFWRESAEVGRRIMAHFGGGKLNVAALGNQVPQLHVHHVVRRDADAAWPRPIWGVAPAKPYDAEAAAGTLTALRALLSDAGLRSAAAGASEPPNKSPPDFSRGVPVPEAGGLSWRDPSASSGRVRER